MHKLLLLLVCLPSLVWSQVHVKGYYRANGTYVKPHERTRPNHTVTDNYSYPGNYNPNKSKNDDRAESQYSQPGQQWTGVKSEPLLLDTLSVRNTTVPIQSVDCYFDAVSVRPLLSDAFLRLTPDSQASSDYQITAPSSVKLIGRKGDYYIANVKGYLRYISLIYIDRSYEEFAARSCPTSSVQVFNEQLLEGQQYTALINPPTFLLDSPSSNASNIALIRQAAEVTLLGSVNGYWLTIINGKRGYLTESGIASKARTTPKSQNFDTIPANMKRSDNAGFARLRPYNDPTYQKPPSEAETERTIREAAKRYNSHTYFTGPRGGCYYISSSGRKQYVDRSYCN